jgi:hypothetical protein
MTRSDKKMLSKHLDLIFEFEKYVLEHPGFAKRIPRNAIVSLRIEGDEAFNRWSRQLAETHTGGKRKKHVFLVNIKKMRPAAPRIEEIKVERAA